LNLKLNTQNCRTEEMVREDLKEAERDQLCKKEGFPVMNYNE
jgi:hypothetical protein